MASEDHKAYLLTQALRQSRCGMQQRAEIKTANNHNLLSPTSDCVWFLVDDENGDVALRRCRRRMW